MDAFQGAEKEIIILSCVRTDHMGFIDCERYLQKNLHFKLSNILICLVWCFIVSFGASCYRLVLHGITEDCRFIQDLLLHFINFHET